MRKVEMRHATIKGTIGNFTPSGFGWTANIPRFDLLAAQFTTPSTEIAVTF